MAEKTPEVPQTYGLSVNTLIFHGEELVSLDTFASLEPAEEAALLDPENLRKEVKLYRKDQPSVEGTIDLGFIQ